LYTLQEPEKFLHQGRCNEIERSLVVVAGTDCNYNDKWFPVARSFIEGKNPKSGIKKALEAL
jgi:hypothetical protein